MNRAKQIHIGFFTKLFLKLLGISSVALMVSCDGDNNGFAVMYGAPADDYKEIMFHGTVKSEDSLQAIPELNIDFVSDEMRFLTTTTGQQGEYSLYFGVTKGQQYKIVVSDTDSLANFGYFDNKEIEIVVSGRDLVDGEHETDILLKRKP